MRAHHSAGILDQDVNIKDGLDQDHAISNRILKNPDPYSIHNRITLILDVVQPYQ